MPGKLKGKQLEDLTVSLNKLSGLGQFTVASASQIQVLGTASNPNDIVSKKDLDNLSTIHRVNEQKNIPCNLTEFNYDTALDQLIEYEPSSPKAVDIYVNGLKADINIYRFGEIQTTSAITNYIEVSPNIILIDNTEAPNVDDYLDFSDGVNNYYRRVSATATGLTATTVTYTGYDVPSASYSIIDKLEVNVRPIQESDTGDLILWLGEINSNISYNLNKDDDMSLDYFTKDSNAS